MHDNNICDWCGDECPEKYLEAWWSSRICPKCWKKRHKIGTRE